MLQQKNSFASSLRDFPSRELTAGLKMLLRIHAIAILLTLVVVLGASHIYKFLSQGEGKVHDHDLAVTCQSAVAAALASARAASATEKSPNSAMGKTNLGETPSKGRWPKVTGPTPDLPTAAPTPSPVATAPASVPVKETCQVGTSLGVYMTENPSTHSPIHPLNHSSILAN